MYNQPGYGAPRPPFPQGATKSAMPVPSQAKARPGRVTIFTYDLNYETQVECPQRQG